METRPIHFNVSPELKLRWNKLPWGTRTHMLRKLLEMGCDIYDRHGELGLGAVLSERIKLTSDAIVEHPTNGRIREQKQ